MAETSLVSVHATAPKLKKSKKRPRTKITEKLAIAIYEMKLRNGKACTAVEVGNLFGVSEKVVRDVWKARTWSIQTLHLDTKRSSIIRKIGRPKGCRDSRPRNKSDKNMPNVEDQQFSDLSRLGLEPKMIPSSYDHWTSVDDSCVESWTESRFCREKSKNGTTTCIDAILQAWEEGETEFLNVLEDPFGWD
jgi:hypothetical protein